MLVEIKPDSRGLDPAIQTQNPKRWNLLCWMAASEGGHDNKGIPNNFDTL